jgi:hypothetical protein
MDPRDFHTLAGRLASGPTTNLSAAECRTAISRSYYAVFNVAAEQLRRLGLPIGKGAAAHGEVQKCLANSGEPALVAAASDLGDLHSSRNRADYQLDKPDVEKAGSAQAVVTLAGSVIRTIDGAFQGSRRAAILTTIQQWRRANGYP